MMLVDGAIMAQDVTDALVSCLMVPQDVADGPLRCAGCGTLCYGWTDAWHEDGVLVTDCGTC